jgi:hypothetical protein
MTTTDTDLFGKPLDARDGPRPPRGPLNDMGLIEKVLQIAETTGYVLVGASEQVYHLIGRGQIETAPSSRPTPCTSCSTPRG